MGARCKVASLTRASVSILMFPLAGVAAELDGSGSPAALDEQQLLFAEIPTVFAASKYEQRTTQAPSAVSIITADEIRKYGYRTLDEILQSVPGFYFTRDRNYTYAGIRGFGRPGDYNGRLLLLVDGVRLNDAVYDQAPLGHVLPIDIDLIERLEIIRGPSSSLYGANAFFGVINVVTKNGRDYQGLELAGSVGRFETLEGRATFGERFNAGVEMLLSGSYFDSAGPEQLYYAEFDDPATHNGVTKNTDDEAAKQLFLELAYKDFSLSSSYHWREKGIPTGAYGTVFNDPRTRTVDEYFYVDLRYQHLFTNGTHFFGDINYQYYDYDGDYLIDYSEEDEPYLVVNKDNARGRAWSSLAQFTFNLGVQHRVIVGGELRWKQRQDQKNFDEQQVYLDDRRYSFDWGLFVQDEWSVRDNLTVNAGLRYDQYGDLSGTVNPRLALIYNPWKTTAIKLIYGTAFRAPNSYEQFYQDGGMTMKPAEELDAETIRTAELVLEQQITRYLRATGDIFYYQVADLITLQTDPQDDLLIFRNTDTIDAYGIEGWLEGKWPSGWETRVSYTFTQTEQEPTGASLSNSPNHLLKGNLTAPLVRNRVFAAAEAQYTSARKTVRGNQAPGYAIANLTLYAPSLWKGLSISASIYNAFDKQYSHPGSEEHIQGTILQDGRSYRVKLYYAF